RGNATRNLRAFLGLRKEHLAPLACLRRSILGIRFRHLAAAAVGIVIAIAIAAFASKLRRLNPKQDREGRAGSIYRHDRSPWCGRKSGRSGLGIGAELNAPTDQHSPMS